MANVTVSLTATELKTLNSILAKAEAAKTVPTTSTASTKPTKKAAAKKAATAAPTKRPTKRSAVSKRNSKTSMAKMTTNGRLVINTKTLDKAGLYGHRVHLLQNANKNEFLMIDAKVKIPAQYKIVRTVNLPYGPTELYVKRVFGMLPRGYKIVVTVSGNTIKFKK